MDIKDKAYGICLYKESDKIIEILLCKSIKSKDKWGFLKGHQELNETKQQTALREFFEESSIKIKSKYLENYFEQINLEKDIGIYLVNAKNIDNLESYFINNKLYNNYLSDENSKVEFFNLNNIPEIKKKQYKIMDRIIQHLKKDN